ncbi:hypothetical protein [Dyella amyloliquefaciens]|uniref:hypothetical protein n=1 Tax=Dyella amyloliquefaciens TaxID=1770545 RepID=UPI00102E3CAF|nr:hypothetical protein [Dyella amyloliquefaciens]
MNILPFVAIALGLAVENVVAYLFGLNLRMTNGFFAAGAIFFVLSQSPRTMVGFAVTPREWGDRWRHWLGPGERFAPSRSESRWAAHRSIAILSLFVLVGFSMIWIRPQESAGSMQTDTACLTGMGLGFWAGYLAVMARRAPSSP